MHPRRLRCSSLKYSRYSRSSRLASGAPRPSRCDVAVGPERSTPREPRAGIQRLRGQERRLVPRFKIQSPVPSRPRDVDDVVQECPPRSGPAQRAWRAHGLDLALRLRELFERRAAQKRVAVPCRPEGNAGRLELVRVEGEHVLRRRQLVHVPEVLFEKGEHLGPRQIVELDAQRGYV